MMDMKGNMIEMEGMRMQNQVMDMNMIMYPEINSMSKNGSHDSHQQGAHSMHSSDIVTLNYAMLRSPNTTSLPAGPVKELKFDLTGNMDRYVWSLNNKVVSESDKILIKKGEIVRIILFNNSMMRHPMHLHGHDFRLLNGQGEYAPMKNIIDIMPMERDTIEFYASEPGGDWFFHCHILYHMMSGMGRVLSYENSPANPEITDTKVAERGLNSDDRRFHLMGKIGVETNGSDGEFMLGQTRWNATAMWHLGYHDYHGYEAEATIGRYFGKMQWWNPYVGFDYHFKRERNNHENGIFTFNGSPENIFGNEEKNMFGQTSNKNDRKAAIIGVGYTLPLLFVADLRVDSDGKVRFQLSREDIAVSRRLRFALMANTDKEYMAGLRYIWTKYISFSIHYDSDMGQGAGLTFTY